MAKCQSPSGAALAAAAAAPPPPPKAAAAGNASEGVAGAVAATFAAGAVVLESALATSSSPRSVGIACARDGHAFANTSNPKNIADTANFCIELKRNSFFYFSP